MKRFVIRFVVFVVALVPLSYLCDWIFTQMIIYGNRGYYAEWCDIYQGNIDADLVILGSSRAKRHFNPHIIEDSLNISAYNLGFTAATFDAVYLKFMEYYKNSAKKPKYVTLALDCGSLEIRQNMFDHWRVLPFMMYHQDTKDILLRYKCFKSYYYYLPLVRYSGYCYTIFRKFVLTRKILYHGYYVNDPILQHWNEQEFQKNILKFSEGSNCFITEYEETLLRDFICFCNNENIEVNLVYTPEFYLGQSFTSNRDSILKNFKMIADEYNIPFENFSLGAINRDTAFFSNVSHLNCKGADEFTSVYYIPYLQRLYGL